MRFQFSARVPGYVTLIALQSNGYASVLAQNVYVNAGTTFFPRPEDGVMYNWPSRAASSGCAPSLPACVPPPTSC